jgi:hypothetical protein
MADCFVASLACPILTKCLPPLFPLAFFSAPLLGAPADPNAITGPAGVASQRWVDGGSPLSYNISFGNESDANGSAQRVIVTQPLNASLDSSTLKLLGIVLPNGNGPNIQVPTPLSLFSPSAGVNEFIAMADLRPIQKLLVAVDAKWDSAVNILTWTLTSIDPQTGAEPFDGTGFLPPGAAASVAFSVKPRQLATGVQIADQAAVVFDNNSPLNTPTWTNTIDNTLPVSKVSALTGTSSCPAFRVNWSGSDVGSGLQGFALYVSDNGGPFTPWLSNTTAVTANYLGTVGHTYAFYSIATDLVGNLEGAKTTAEASMSVTAAGPCGPPNLSEMSNAVQSGTTVTATLTLTNTGFTAASVALMLDISPKI